jgi:hypothetical protein
MRPLMWLAALLVSLVPVAAAQDIYSMPPEVMEYAITDGAALELDDAGTLAALEDVRERISGQSIHDCIDGITNDVPYNYRVMGTPTQQQFLAKYGTVFSDLGLPSAVQQFPGGGPGVVGQPPEPLQGGANLIGALPGNDTSNWIVLGGHYDTREFTLGGGALDNAAGICTVLELAKAFKANADATGPLEASVIFVWYDGEEWGLYGAQAFAEDVSVAAGLVGLEEGTAPTILVSQSYDMPGLNYPAKNNWVQYGDPLVTDEYAVLNLRTAPIHPDTEWLCASYACYEDLKGREDFAAVLRNNANWQFLIREVAYDVLGLPPAYVWVYDDHYGRSDHMVLIAQGAAGNRIQGSHDNEYPHYHQPTDSLPGLYALTGGTPDGIIAGFQTEAEAGGLAAYYVAKTGSLGGYGDKLYPQNGTLNATQGPADTAPDEKAPLPAVLAFGSLAFAAVALRRRRDNP